MMLCDVWRHRREVLKRLDRLIELQEKSLRVQEAILSALRPPTERLSIFFEKREEKHNAS